MILFIALVALVTLMLAAIALVRTVDTSTVVAGNLAFKQAATTSGDGGYEQAIKWLTATDTANSGIDQWAAGNAHPFNVNNAAIGYYVNVDPAFDLSASSTWTSGNSADGGTDASGNAIRYVIQRMCRDTTAYLTEGNCLFNDASGGPKNNGITGYGGAGAQVGGKNVLFRITVRVTGPRNSISYIQGFTY
ncbi:pilus assembly PilX family protein [Undibacterium terreum]|uniref:Tfp pilus assembly protein PilX n=1 Tax=Undibacterium terreum TaxID=1224302 RepID=A0A916UG44_9BURK|nr:hypothetical protein [Undibacterium terreum]GGC71199.1 hypothetical protein GCM10011396_17930 [Undibacterium terreum]